MNLRFSRSSLNLIIFACIILIGWASIEKNRSLEAVDQPELAQKIELPKLTDLNYGFWTSQENIRVFWQSRLDTDFQIRVRGEYPSHIQQSRISDAASIDWQPGYWQWDLNLGANFETGIASLSNHLKSFPNDLKHQKAVLIMQGPWSKDIAKLTGAKIITSLQLKSKDDSTILKGDITSSTRLCPWQPVSAQFWLQDQLANKNLSQPDMKQKHWKITQWPQLPSITPTSLRIWKQTFVKQWQLNWQNPSMQFDILADLAYYRLPQNYLLQGYWGIDNLDTAQLEAYLSQCKAPNT